MGATNNARVKDILNRVRAVRASREVTVRTVCKEINELLADSEQVTLHAVVKWMSPKHDAGLYAESVLALQEWLNQHEPK